MKKILLLGSGELGKEFTISAQRLGCEIIACDSYPDAPAMQVANSSKVFDMLDASKLKNVVYSIKPDFIVPEIEAIRTEELLKLEEQGFNVVPSAKAVNLTMNRDEIRDRATRLGIRTAKYEYASNIEELFSATKKIGFPCIVKPVMSSSGKGQTKINGHNDIEKAWFEAASNMRGDRSKVIVEEFINFKSEITLLTVKQKKAETIYCSPVGHIQSEGDYVESWQPCDIKPNLLRQAQNISKKVTDDLGGYGVFGVEFFVLENEVIFSELSPRPHDTGMVTMFTQNLNEFDLHLRALLGLPIPNILLLRKGYSTVIKAGSNIPKNSSYKIGGLEKALLLNNVDVRVFGKLKAWPGRRLGVILSSDKENGETAKRFITIEEK
ncbi:formate-dependent phosphoribosylglycinamide formyltransferase [Alphaproteobacteria bacterium]|nr:formate-dependent phosphoribosylglycinamide formyltransferase [Alphaproteobacteria bacterium]